MFVVSQQRVLLYSRSVMTEYFELIQWIEYVLVGDGVIKDIKMEKYNFTVSDFKRTLITFWVNDDPFFIHGRHRVQFPFLTHEFLCTGARIGAYCPANKDKNERGLRYKVSLMLSIQAIIWMFTFYYSIYSLFFFELIMHLGGSDGVLIKHG